MKRPFLQTYTRSRTSVLHTTRGLGAGGCRTPCPDFMKEAWQKKTAKKVLCIFSGAAAKPFLDG